MGQDLKKQGRIQHLGPFQWGEMPFINSLIAPVETRESDDGWAVATETEVQNRSPPATSLGTRAGAAAITTVRDHCPARLVQRYSGAALPRCSPLPCFPSARLRCRGWSSAEMGLEGGGGFLAVPCSFVAGFLPCSSPTGP